MIIGVTDEKQDVVDKWIASKKKTGYPIAILNGDLERTLGVPHFPFNGVIGPDGNITYAGDSPGYSLKEAMKTAKAGSMWPKKLANAAKMLRESKLGDAWVELQKVGADTGLDAREKAVHQKFVTYVQDTSSAAVKDAEADFKKDLVYAAYTKASSIADAKPPLPASDDAKKLVGEIKAFPNFDAEMKGGEVFAKARELEESQDYLEAVNAFKDAMKKAPGTKIADMAKAKAENLISRGMPGFSPVCEKCAKAKKACDKHAKPVKL